MTRTAPVTAALFAALFVAPLLAPVPATAAGQNGKTVHVRYADLNLGTPEGIASLDRRIGRAVNAVCEPDESRVFSQKIALMRCRNAALASVAEQRVHALASHKAEVQVAGGR